MVARPSGVLNRHRGFQNIGLTNPVFTVEDSSDTNPIHTAQEICTESMHGVKPITAGHLPTARPAEMSLLIKQQRRPSYYDDVEKL